MRRRILIVGMAAAGALMAFSGAPAGAAVTLGQTGPPEISCGSPQEWLTAPGNAGNSYVVPGTGGVTDWTVTSWSHQANAEPGGVMKLKIYRQVSGLNFTVVGQDVPRAIQPSQLNTFRTDLPVRPGDMIGFSTLSGAIGCGIGAPDQTYYFTPKAVGTFANGASFSFTSATGRVNNISAVVDPVNTFTLGTVTRNKARGTATVSLDLPNPGTVTVSGNGATVAGDSSASVPAGHVALTIRATGKKLRKLKRKGRVTLQSTVTYTPTQGSPSSQPITLALRKKLKT